MRKYVFLPMSDEIMKQHPELLTAPMMPFDLSFPCCRILDEEEQAADQGGEDER
ncbi:MAG: hypothetical protein ACE5DY_02985 [Mariprofundaceae bacterium]